MVLHVVYVYSFIQRRQSKYHCLVWEVSQRIGDPDRPRVDFHFNHPSHLSNKCEQLTLLSELSVISLGFQSGGSNHISYINKNNLILGIVNLVLEKLKY